MSQRSRTMSQTDYLSSQSTAIEGFLGGRRTYKRKPKAVRAPKGVSKNVVQFVKKSIASVSELKKYTNEGSQSLWTSAATQAQFVAGNMLQLTPYATGASYNYTITQGTGQGQRIGNSIRIKKAWLRFVLYPQQYNVTSNPTPQPQDVRLLIFSIKPAVTTGATTKEQAWTILNTNFFANGNSSNGQLGNLYDMVSYPNPDVVSIYFDRQMKLGFSTISGMTGQNTINLFGNNDYTLNCQMKIEITKFLPAKITFNDDNNSTSRQLFAVFMPVNSDGTGPVSTRIPASMFYGLDVQYIDA